MQFIATGIVWIRLNMKSINYTAQYIYIVFLYG